MASETRRRSGREDCVWMLKMRFVKDVLVGESGVVSEPEGVAGKTEMLNCESMTPVGRSGLSGGVGGVPRKGRRWGARRVGNRGVGSWGGSLGGMGGSAVVSGVDERGEVL